jgi:SAM-dependent methyltransferase
MRALLIRKTYIAVFTFFTFLQTGLSLPADQRNFETESALLAATEKLGELQAEQMQAFYTWKTAMRLLIQFQQPVVSRPLEDYLAPERFYKLNISEQIRLRKELPAIKKIESLVNRQYFDNLRDRCANQKKLVSRLQKKLNADSVKKIFSQYHKGQIDIKYADLDMVLALDYDSVESKVDKTQYPQTDTWIGFPKFQTQTDYNVIKKVFSSLDLTENDIFYDLGSGYGRVIFYGSILYPKTTFKGVEFVEDRVKEARRLAHSLNLENANFIAKDVLKQDLSDGSVFYIFNSFPSLMWDVLRNLKKVAEKKIIRIVAVGRTASELKHVDWLKIEKQIDRSGLSVDVVIYKSEIK